jgi:hypothetical protein
MLPCAQIKATNAYIILHETTLQLNWIRLLATTLLPLALRNEYIGNAYRAHYG